VFVEQSLIRLAAASHRNALLTIGDEDPITVRVASSKRERRAATHLVQDAYEWRGYGLPYSAVRPDMVTLLADRQGVPVGTLSLAIDSELGLGADATHGDTLDQLRAHGRRLSEFTAFAIDRTLNSPELVAKLFAKQVHQTDDLLLEVNPRHVRFYNRIVGCEQIAEVRHDGRVDAPGVLMRVDLERAIALYRMADSDRNSRQIYRHFGDENLWHDLASRIAACVIGSTDREAA
jgi:hypothetical protein